jgi:hypothetical protein
LPRIFASRIFYKNALIAKITLFIVGARMSKLATLLRITVLALSSLAMVGCVFAQSIPKPSVPEFTVQFVDFYDVPPTYEVDPNTGETVITQEGFRVDSNHIVVTIKNQPFTPYTDADGNFVRLYYDVYFKYNNKHWLYLKEFFSSDSEYTVKGFICGNQAGAPELRTLRYGDKLDFKVQAYIGYTAIGFNPELSPLNANFIGETSGWSDIQTLTIPDVPPNVTLLSPQNRSFNNSDVPLDFAVNKSALIFKYSLDGGENVTIAGNTTLTELAYGYHNVTVYAEDRIGNIGASETIYFNVEKPLTALIVFITIIVAVVGVGLVLLGYGIKRKK